MNLVEIEEIPEGENAPVIAEYFYAWYAEVKCESVYDSLMKLSALADAQWRSKELQSKTLRLDLTSWLQDNYRELASYAETVLGIAYCFGLDKKYFRRVLESYDGDAKAEFEEHLSMSDGDSIDPYWSLRSKDSLGQNDLF